MIRFLTFILPFLCLQSSAAFAAELTLQEQIGLLKAANLVQNGQEPSSDLTGIAKMGAKAQRDLHELIPALHSASIESKDNCKRFFATTEGFAMQLEKIPGLPLGKLTDEQLEAEVRYEILLASFAELAFLMQRDSEQSFSILDTHVHASCPVSARSHLLTLMEKTLDSLSNYHQERFGLPGLSKIYETQRRLLQLAAVDRDHGHRNTWLILGIGTLASITFWEFAPAAASAMVRLAWGYSPRFVALPAFLYAAKTTALTAEGVAFGVATELAAGRPRKPDVSVGTWDEHMDILNLVLNSPDHSPELYSMLLSRIQAQIFGRERVWLETFSTYIDSEERRWGTLERAIQYHESQLPN
jgi:hypothetical protein